MCFEVRETLGRGLRGARARQWTLLRMWKLMTSFFKPVFLQRADNPFKSKASWQAARGCSALLCSARVNSRQKMDCDRPLFICDPIHLPAAKTVYLLLQSFSKGILGLARCHQQWPRRKSGHAVFVRKILKDLKRFKKNVFEIKFLSRFVWEQSSFLGGGSGSWRFF